MSKSLIELLKKYNSKKIIDQVKNEGSNFNTRTIILKVIVTYDILGFEESYQGTYIGHAFSKACQYVTTNEKIC